MTSCCSGLSLGTSARELNELGSGLLAEVLHMAVQRGQQAVVVQHRGSQLASEREQFLHRLARKSLCLGQLAAQARRRLLDRRLEPQRYGRQRLVDLVVES